MRGTPFPEANKVSGKFLIIVKRIPPERLCIYEEQKIPVARGAHSRYFRACAAARAPNHRKAEGVHRKGQSLQDGGGHRRDRRRPRRIDGGRHRPCGAVLGQRRRFPREGVRGQGKNPVRSLGRRRPAHLQGHQGGFHECPLAPRRRGQQVLARHRPGYAERDREHSFRLRLQRPVLRPPVRNGLPGGLAERHGPLRL